MKYIGIDYGLKKVGLAISEGQIATAFKVIPISGLKDGVEKIKKVVIDEGVSRVVIGIAESGESRKAVLAFIRELKKVLEGRAEIIEVEETLSSNEAREYMLGLGISQKRRKEEDAYAAAIILQKFLNSL